MPGTKWFLLIAAVLGAITLGISQWMPNLSNSAALWASLAVTVLGAVAKAIEVWATQQDQESGPPGAMMADQFPVRRTPLQRWWNG